MALIKINELPAARDIKRFEADRGTERDVSTMPKALAAAIAASIVSTMFGAPAAVAEKKEKSRVRPNASQSLDGRVLGYPRTCGHDFFIYSGTGSPVGPYCH